MSLTFSRFDQHKLAAIYNQFCFKESVAMDNGVYVQGRLLLKIEGLPIKASEDLTALSEPVKKRIEASLLTFLTKKSTIKDRKPARQSYSYTLNEAKYEAVWREWRGQAALVVRSMQELKAVNGIGATSRQILENCKETREVGAPSGNGVNQHLNRLKRAGLVTLLNPEVAKNPPSPVQHLPPPKKKR